jgi:7-cyano-7-deazaguanine synthase
MTKRRAVLLLSGGLDSATAGAVALGDGFEVHALSFSYGQRHVAELDAARTVARRLGVRDHRIISIDLRAFGGSALTDDIAVPKDREVGEMSAGIPVTYVPARNTIFLSYALAWTEVLQSSDIYLGVNALDYSGYPDCRPEYIASFQAMARLATKAGVEGSTELTIHAPLIALTKAQIITLGVGLGIDYAITVSCYEADNDGAACGRCDSCGLRRHGFVEAGLPDPTRYQPEAGPA